MIALIGLGSLFGSILSEGARSDAQQYVETTLRARLGVSGASDEWLWARTHAVELQILAIRAWEDYQAMVLKLLEIPAARLGVDIQALLFTDRDTRRAYLDEAWPRRAEIEEHIGLRVHGHGAGRSVFELVPGLAVKLAIFDDDRRLNLDEARRYRQLPKGVRAMVVPVVDVDFDGRWLIMEEAVPMPLAPSAEIRAELGRKMRLMRLLCKRHGFEGLDLAIYNWGIHDGQVKLLDMAN
jgi:hypothetical protein